MLLLPLLAVLLIIGSGAAGYAVTKSDKIYPNTFAGETALGGMTEEEAEQALAAAGLNETAACPLTVTAALGVTMEVNRAEAGAVLTAESAARAAWRSGREGNYWQNLLQYAASLLEPLDLLAEPLSLDNNYIDRCVAQIARETAAAFGESEYTLDLTAGQMLLVKGWGSMKTDTDTLRAALRAALEKGETELNCSALSGTPTEPDFETIREKVYQEAQDASFAGDGSHTILPEQTGCDFDPQEAAVLWEQAAAGETVAVPLQVTQPAITAAYLEEMEFHDLLGAATTKYNNSAENRCSNVRLAASLIDGVVLYPGEEFSFNETVGVRTEEAGFLPAPAYAGYDDVKDEIGGGVCQVSTTLYASTLFAFLQVTSHTCHLYPPNYIQLGMDATVTIPEGGGRSIDYKFVNNKSWPIRITAYTEEDWYDDGSPYKAITVEIWGTLEDDDFMPVEFDNSYENVYDYDREIEPAYEDREGYKIKFTHEENEFEDDYGKGLRTLTHRKVYDMDGNLVQDRIINLTYSAGYAQDTYYYRYQD